MRCWGFRDSTDAGALAVRSGGRIAKSTAECGVSVVVVGIGEKYGLGLSIFDVSDPVHPLRLGGLNPYLNASSLSPKGNALIITDPKYGVRILDISDPSLPLERDAWEMPGSTNSVSLAEGHVIAAGGNRNVRVFDVSVSSSIDEVASIPFEYDVGRVFLDGHLAYVAGTNSMNPQYSYWWSAIDVSDPVAPIEIGSWQNNRRINDLAVRGGIAYLLDFASLNVYDVTDPSQPIFLSSVSLDSNIRKIALKGNLALVMTGCSLFIIDISDPNLPIEIGSIRIGSFCWNKSVATAGNFAFVSTYNLGLSIIDIQNPTQPQIISLYPVREPIYGMVARDNLVTVGISGTGVVTLDISDPTDPRQVAATSLPSYIPHVVITDDELVVARGVSGFSILSACTSIFMDDFETGDSSGWSVAP